MAQFYTSKYRTRNHQKHKEIGLCVYCTKKAVYGKTRCIYHLEKARKGYIKKAK